jgi:single-strand DNA-binding protein
MNTVTLIGRLTADPKVKNQGADNCIVNFSIAVNERWRDEGGEWKDRASFFECTMFGKRGESFLKFHQKGSLAAITGKLRQERWTSKEGDNRSKIVVLVNDYTLTGKTEQAQGSSPRQHTAPAEEPAGDDWGETPF